MSFILWFSHRIRAMPLISESNYDAMCLITLVSYVHVIGSRKDIYPVTTRSANPKRFRFETDEGGCKGELADQRFLEKMAVKWNLWW